MNLGKCQKAELIFLMSGVLLIVALTWMGCEDVETDSDEVVSVGDTVTESVNPATENTDEPKGDSNESQLTIGDTETGTVGDTNTEIDQNTETGTVGDNEFETAWLTNGYGRLFPDTGVGVSINLGASVTTTISREVKCVTRETLIAFLETNAGMFTADQYEQTINHYSYTRPGFEAELLLGMLGLQLADDFNWFFNKNDIDISPTTPQSEAFLNALNGLVEKEYRLSGPVTAVALSAIPVSPVFYVRVAKLNFVNGVTVRAINTKVTVADENGSQSRVTGKEDEAPLTLTALQ